MIARNTAFAFLQSGKAAQREDDRARVRRSLRFGGQRSAQGWQTGMRVNVQLGTDAENRAIIFGLSGSTSRWPTYSTCRTRSSRGSANTLDAQLVSAEARRAEQAPNPWTSMWTSFSRFGLVFNKGYTPGNVAQARGFF